MTSKPSRTIEVRRQPGESEASALARAAVDPSLTAAVVTAILGGDLGDVSIRETTSALREKVRLVQANDLREVEALLISQAFALNTVFTNFSLRAATNMGHHLDATERYMRLALKAQSQCRTTLETLAAIKNPPVLFARQANIAHGPQQVNNGAAVPEPTRAGNLEGVQDKLLEACPHGERLDTGATSSASASDPQLAPVGEIHRPTNAEGQDPRRAQRLPRRGVAKASRAK